MLSIFPELFTYSLVAPFVLRIALGSFFILQGIRRHKEDSLGWQAVWGDKKIGEIPLAIILAKVELVIGVFIFIGLFTQVVAIIAALFVWAEWLKRKMNKTSTVFLELWLCIFVTAASISLLFLGAGALAFDLPL